MEALRIDKWLWAARFYKTRSLAAEEIGKNRVQVNGQDAKASREVADTKSPASASRPAMGRKSKKMVALSSACGSELRIQSSKRRARSVSRRAASSKARRFAAPVSPSVVARRR